MNALFRTLPAIAALAFAAPASAQSRPPAHHVRGTLTNVTERELTVTTSTGTVSVPIDAHTKIVGVVPATAADIASGSFIGTANVPGPSATAARALEVVVFPPSMAGAGEGDYPWDSPAGRGHSAMTNGTVAARHGHSMMTNGTVMGVNNRADKIITLQYKGGSKMVTIGPGTPIVRAEPGSKGLLRPGTHVFVSGADGAAASFVVAGERGTVPPM